MNIRGFLAKFSGLNDLKQAIEWNVRKQYLEDKIKNCIDLGVSSHKYADANIIVSLTTYGRRLQWVDLTIESIMQQTIKANKIVLWLGEKDFRRPIPYSLRRMEERGLEIRETRDIRSYTKLIPSLIDYPNDIIITIDDDVLYDFELLDKMVSSYQNNPSNIHACRCHVMKYNSSGKLMPYNTWEMNSFDYSDKMNNFFTGVGGVLYPPACHDEDVCNVTVFERICPTADDVWFNAMARKKGTLIDKVPTKSTMGIDYIGNDAVEDMGLYNLNTKGKCLNDIQIKDVWNYCGLARI